MKTEKWLGLGILIIAIAVIAYFIGQGSSNQPPSTNTTSTPIAPATTISNTEKAANSTTSNSSDAGVVLNTPAEWESTPITDNASGEWQKISLGANPVTQEGITFSDTITDLDQSISSSNNLWGQYVWANNNGQTITTTGEFVQVNLTMENNTQSSAVVEVVPYFLADQAGRGFYWESDHSSCSNGADSVNVPQQLEPGIPCTATILFEVSQQSQDFNLDFDMRNDQYNGNVPYGK